MYCKSSLLTCQNISECADKFTNAGAEALVPCNRDFCSVLLERESSGSNMAHMPCQEIIHETCFSASCDWSVYFSNCQENRETFRKCPIFAALAYTSLSQTQGLVYLKEGKGHTVPKTMWPGGYPYEEEYQGLGRCSTTQCREDLHLTSIPANHITIQKCPAETDECVTAQSDGKTLYTCSSLAEEMLHINSTEKKGTATYKGYAWTWSSCEGDRCNDPASQVKQCLVSSADGSSSSVASCSAASDKCVAATSSALGKALYSCSTEAAALFSFDCADSPGTIQYLGVEWAMQVSVSHCCASAVLP